MVILILAALAGFALKLMLDYINKEAVKRQLISNTDYAREHIIGTWSTSDGTIWEFYANGDQVEYTSIRDSVYEDANVPSIIQSELGKVVYSGYAIPDPDAYTDEELDGFYDYIQRTKYTNKIGIVIQSDFHGLWKDGYGLLEFQDENTLISKDIVFTRVGSGEPKITDDASGLYVREDGRFWVSIIERADTNSGYCNIFSSEVGESTENCEIYDNRIVIVTPDIPDMLNYIFERKGTDLIEIGSEQFPGGQVTYKKVSNLMHCSPVDVIPNEENLVIPEEPPIDSDNSDGQAFVESLWEPAIYPKIFGDDSAIRIYCEGYEPVGLDFIYHYGELSGDLAWGDLVFVASESVTNFRIVDLEMLDSLPADYFYYADKTILDVGELLTGQAITASLSFADFPTWGIVYTGPDGRTRAFSVGDNVGGRDIEELEGYAPGVRMWEDVLLEMPTSTSPS